MSVPRVVFGIPSRERRPSLEFSISMKATDVLLLRSGIDTVWTSIGGDPYVHHARSILASTFLLFHPDADKFFMVDDDLSWSPEDALRCVLSDKDIVAGIYPKKNDAPEFPVYVLEDAGKKSVYRRDEWYKAALAPTGFMCVKRKVMEACAEQSGQYPHEDSAGRQFLVWDLFRTGFVPDVPDGKIGRWWGEDYFFGVLARHLGFDIWFDPRMAFGHTGEKMWVDSFHAGFHTWIEETKKQIIEV